MVERIGEVFEYGGDRVARRDGVASLPARAKRPSTTLHGRSNILLAVPEIYRRLARNFRLARWLRLTVRRGRPHLPRRSIDLPPPGSRANPRSGMLAARPGFSLALRNTFFRHRWLIHLARRQGHWKYPARDNAMLFNNVIYVVRVIVKRCPLMCKIIHVVFFQLTEANLVAIKTVIIFIHKILIRRTLN